MLEDIKVVAHDRLTMTALENNIIEVSLTVSNIVSYGIIISIY